LLDQPDNLCLVGCVVSHASSPPSPRRPTNAVFRQITTH
jgi:hypothetical protein